MTALVCIPIDTVSRLAGNADSLVALIHAARQPGTATGREFSLSARAEAAELGWTQERYRKAREALVSGGLILRVENGGMGKGDRSRFKMIGRPAWVVEPPR